MPESITITADRIDATGETYGTDPRFDEWPIRETLTDKKPTRAAVHRVLRKAIRAWGDHDGVSLTNAEQAIDRWDQASNLTIVVQSWNRSGRIEVTVTGFPEPVEPVGIVEIAERLGVQRATVDQWKQRGLLPEPSWTVGGRPAWNWPDIARWAHETGRS